MRQSAHAVLLTLLTGWQVPRGASSRLSLARICSDPLAPFTSNRTETPEVVFYERWPDTVIGTLGAGCIGPTI